MTDRFLDIVAILDEAEFEVGDDQPSPDALGLFGQRRVQQHAVSGRAHLLPRKEDRPQAQVDLVPTRPGSCVSEVREVTHAG